MTFPLQNMKVMTFLLPLNDFRIQHSTVTEDIALFFPFLSLFKTVHFVFALWA